MSTDLPAFHNWIRGERVSPQACFETFDPFTGRPWARIPACTARDVDAAVVAAREAFNSESWAGLTPSHRGRLLTRLADLIERDAERLVKLASTARLGNPADRNTQVGPIATQAQRERVLNKRSGIGRENGQEAIESYLQTKSVWIDTSGKTADPFVIR